MQYQAERIHRGEKSLLGCRKGMLIVINCKELLSPTDLPWNSTIIWIWTV